MLRRAARVFAEEEIAQEEGQRWGWVATCAAIVVWEEEYYHAMVARRGVQLARDAGAPCAPVLAVALELS